MWSAVDVMLTVARMKLLRLVAEALVYFLVVQVSSLIPANETLT